MLVCFVYVVHLVVEHSAVLCDIQGPLGFWSQQSYEGSHKIAKQTFSRSTNHGGGRIRPQTKQIQIRASPAYQMISKHCRTFVLNIRQAIDQGLTPELWKPYVSTVFAESIEEHYITKKTYERDTRRLKRDISKILAETHKSPNDSTDTGNFVTSPPSEMFHTPPDRVTRLKGALRLTPLISKISPSPTSLNANWYAEI